MELTRRRFLKTTAAVGATTLLTRKAFALKTLAPVVEVGNPLDTYPDKDWEKIYRDQYRYDRSFTFICSPNDTHECRVRAFVRNGVVMRVEQNYDHQNYGDLYGNNATRNWNPRMCLKGYTFHRRVYGAYRLKGPIIRKGWKRWADDDFPELTPENISKYLFDARGQDEFLPISWDEVFTYVAKAMVVIARRYSGEEGKKRLLEQGYQPEMLEHWDGAGTRCMKFRGGMGLLGTIGIYGLYRFANMMALLDSHIRGVGPDEAQGARRWSNYTWHGDQAPGHPWVHGLQTSDIDFNDLRFSKLTIQVGKNLIENKMPEAHWLNEMMERGGRIVVITPEYSPAATKADYWIPVRAGLSDISIFLGVSKIIIDKKWYDADFMKKFTDFPLVLRADTLRLLRAADIFDGYKNQDISNGPSVKIYGLTAKEREEIGDFVVFDKKTQSLKAITRDDVGDRLAEKGIEPELEWKGITKTVDGKEVELLTIFEAYKVHLKDYDLDTVHQISHAPKKLIEQLAYDIAHIKPVSIHYGEGINHWFHATLHNRVTYLPLMLTGNIGKPGAGAHTWAGNYKAANWQASPWSGPGFKGWIAEDPFHMNLDPNADGKDIKAHSHAYDEEVGYWAHGDKALIVDTPKYGHKVFTGKSHMPTPTKFIWYTNVNLINNAKWVYELLKNVHPKIELIISSDIELTGSVEYSDIAFAANSWMEKEVYEITSSCSNPFLQIWKGGIKPLYDTKDDLVIMSELAARLGEVLGDQRFADYWKFGLERKSEVYIQRLLDSSTTTRGYKFEDLIAGKYGVPGGALMLFRTYPRTPFWEQVHESHPFLTEHGRIQAYTDVPEAIEYGENFIVHREGPEATPYLPNAIVTTNPYIRPDDYGISLDEMDADKRTIRNVKRSWQEVKEAKNPLWEKGYRFYCITPKSRHTTHSQWAVLDWNFIWNNNYGDPYRMDKRMAGVGDWMLHMNPQAAKELGINDGDYVWVDANPADRPYVGWKPNDPFYKVARCMVRVKYNPSYPYHVTMMKHASWIATERTVKAHETRPDGRALSETGYQSNFRYGSQQSFTRSWLMPMHQTDTLFHKKKVDMSFMRGFEADNHGLNTVPKETLVKITKAEDGGLGGRGVWEPARTGFSPGNEKEFMEMFLRGETIKVKT